MKIKQLLKYYFIGFDSQVSRSVQNDHLTYAINIYLLY